ncbi:MAG: putative solute-binding protein [Gammaproteobacteria bacterium]
MRTTRLPAGVAGLSALLLAAGLFTTGLFAAGPARAELPTPTIAPPAQVPKNIIKAKFCVFDIAGAHGDIFRTMRDYRLEMLKHGVDFELIPYTSEKVAAEDFKAGQCDAVDLTSFRARNFIKFAGTVDAVGALPTRQHVKYALQALSNPAYASKLRSGPYEVAGIVPIGAAYVFTRDRKIDTITKAAGKRVAVLDYDPEMAGMVARLGASPVPTDLTSFAGKFNNGSVDIIVAPLAAYKPLELYKGLEPNGAIIDFPFTQISAMVIVRHEKFPPETLQFAREQVFQNVDKVYEILDKMSLDVPKKWWVSIPAADKLKYDTLMRDTRIELRNRGYYDGEALALLRKVRCKVDNARAECTDKLE